VLLNPIAQQRLISAANKAFVFDGTGFNVEKFAEQMSALTPGRMKGQSIPTTGTHDYGGSVGDAVTVEPAAVAAKVQQLFGMLPTPPSSPASTDTSGPARGASTASAPATTKRDCVY
jgi:hypothetical protein